MYFCIITNCSGERSFSKLKLIKDYRWSTAMTQENLIDRTILSTECGLLRNLIISDIIDDFADEEARKKIF